MYVILDFRDDSKNFEISGAILNIPLGPQNYGKSNAEPNMQFSPK